MYGIKISSGFELIFFLIIDYCLSRNFGRGPEL